MKSLRKWSQGSEKSNLATHTTSKLHIEAASTMKAAVVVAETVPPIFQPEGQGKAEKQLQEHPPVEIEQED